ncbi:hypothetical protein RB195_005619 [Necator americanus]|uniref:Uncharacterized protein n=1 Tax=Necator americanus TaxID=51031 RepID=A0ABR1BNS4_NECAM
MLSGCTSSDRVSQGVYHCQDLPPSWRQPVVKAKLAMTGLLSMEKSQLGAPVYRLSHYSLHCPLPSQTSDGMQSTKLEQSRFQLPGSHPDLVEVHRDNSEYQTILTRFRVIGC